jgi:hypothetical protein
MKLATLTLLAFGLFHHPLDCQSTSKDDPPTALWRAIKRELSGPDGREYFDKNVRDALLPTLYGTLVSSSHADHPDIFLVAMADSSDPEVTMNLEGRLEKPLPAGTLVEFEGVAVAFTTAPFMLTFDVEKLHFRVRPRLK